MKIPTSFIETSRGIFKITSPAAKFVAIVVDPSYHAPYPPEQIYSGDKGFELHGAIQKHINDMGWKEKCYIMVFTNGLLTKKIECEDR